MIVHDAATTFITLIDQAVLIVQASAAAAAFTLCVLAFAVGPLVAPTARAARRALPRPARRRPVPSWAHTEPYDYDEAA